MNSRKYKFKKNKTHNLRKNLKKNKKSKSRKLHGGSPPTFRQWLGMSDDEFNKLSAVEQQNYIAQWKLQYSNKKPKYVTRKEKPKLTKKSSSGEKTKIKKSSSDEKHKTAEELAEEERLRR